ncbi:autoinducer binding domain-containing protein [Variovorax sp. J22G21]|uniref:autoinducer binding domain-containing protein n=1 Tax=Variovorax fucosicus TaxID=3053517 RepID=UPI0025755137|nr:MULTISPECIES: autoinducer binding domain-containing protein [unclassified Variovorax]MDM0042001.1 autoinducer binding domain-containing protein [Variovorax sp. J22R193]MDM0057084.1 autoinducer binding domain-containing protein [Variovorax sp. J22G47]MDM0059771.1 autoinducer binding domain-containing protein [Variovorax sp. J22G21]
MQPFNENLLTALDRATSEEVVFRALLAAANELGFEHCAYGLRLAVPVSNPKVITLNNYPKAWQERYQQAGYLAVDPSVRHGRLSQQPLLWGDEVFDSAKQLWAEAKEHGLRIGWAQSSLDGFGVGGMLTLSRATEVLTARELQVKESEMRWLVQAAHLSLSRLMKPKFAVQPEVPLTPREIEVLKWSADGKTAGEISDILSISIPTVNFHIKNVVQKMKAANKTAAVVQALLSGLLN